MIVANETCWNRLLRAARRGRRRVVLSRRLLCCTQVCREGKGRRGISLRNIRLKAVFTKLIQSQEQILIQSGGNKYTADSLCAHMGVNRGICRHIYIHTYICIYLHISVCMCLWLRTEWKRVNTNAIEFILKWPKKGGQRERPLAISFPLSLAVWLRCKQHLAWHWHAAPIRTLHKAYAQFVQGARCVELGWAKYYNRAHNFSKLQLLISISIARPRTFLYNHPSLPPQAISSTKRPHTRPF